MKKALKKALALALILLPSMAWATGPIVGTNCTARWGAVTTNTDGSAVTGTITYNLYLAQGTPTLPPVNPTTTGITTLSTKPCLSLAPGQYTIWVTAVETFSASTSESAKSAAFPFVLVAPTVPSVVVE